MCIVISILWGERLTERYDDLFLLGNIALKAKLEAKSLKKSMFCPRQKTLQRLLPGEYNIWEYKLVQPTCRAFLNNSIIQPKPLQNPKGIKMQTYMSCQLRLSVYRCFPFSEHHPCLHASNLWNGKTFSGAVSIFKKVPIMQCVYAQGGFSPYPVSFH